MISSDLKTFIFPDISTHGKTVWSSWLCVFLQFGYEDSLSHRFLLFLLKDPLSSHLKQSALFQKRSLRQRTVPGDGRNTARCFGFDGITLGVLKMHIPSHFLICSKIGVAVIRSAPAVISFISGGPATEICCSSVLLGPHLQIWSEF